MQLLVGVAFHGENKCTVQLVLLLNACHFYS